MLHLTSLYAALLSLIIVFLAVKVIIFRKTKKVGLGANGDKHGLQLIRAHANAIEYIPMIVILMAIYELNGGSSMYIHVIGVTALISRIIHAFGLFQSGGVSFGRLYGAGLTLLVTLALVGLNLFLYFNGSTVI